jgi:hypothetical protein
MPAAAGTAYLAFVEYANEITTTMTLRSILRMRSSSVDF